MITIRPFEQNDEDYRQAVDITNSVWPEYPDTVEEWKEGDEKRSKLLKVGRFFAELDGQKVGFANYGQSLWVNHPGKLFVGIAVLPEFRKRGVGTALWEHLCQEVQQFDPLRLLAHTREDYEEGIRFALKLGFNECMRDWESRLDPASLDMDEWGRYARQVAEQGIEIRTVAELESDPNRDRKLYELEWLIDRDVPSPEPPSKVPYEEFQKIWERTNLLPDAWFVAVDNGEYVGMTNLWTSQANAKLLYVGITGVTRSHRKRGIAMALKVRSVEYALQKGFSEIRTWNEINNKAMLGINNRLGFVRQPAHIEFRKVMREERPEDANLKIQDSSQEEEKAEISNR